MQLRLGAIAGGHSRLVQELDICDRAIAGKCDFKERLQLVSICTGGRRPMRLELAEHLGYPVSFKPGAKGAGEMRLRFHSLDELDGLLERMGYREE